MKSSSYSFLTHGDLFWSKSKTFDTLIVLWKDSFWKKYKSYNDLHLSRDMRFPKTWYVRPARPKINLRIRAVLSEPLLVA